MTEMAHLTTPTFLSVGSTKCWLYSYYNIVSQDKYLKSQSNIVVFEILMAGTYKD